jgi:thiol-disulfide isomerase/thioredoxin
VTERIIFSAGLILVGVVGYLVARNAHLALVKRRQGHSGQDNIPGLGAFEPGQPAVLYFTTDGCIPCRTNVKPMLQRLITELGDRFQVLEIDAMHQPEATRYWSVLSVPTIFVLDPHGKPRHVHYGVVSQNVLRTELLGG